MELAIVRNRSSLSCTAASAFFCSVISCATFDAPTIRPAESLIAETVTDTFTLPPSLRKRTVSKCRTLSPRRIFPRISVSSCSRSGGINRVMDWPTISSAGYPKIRSAPSFQLVTMPHKSLPIMASSENSTIAAK